MVEEKIEHNSTEHIQFMWLEIRKGSKWKQKGIELLT